MKTIAAFERLGLPKDALGKDIFAFFKTHEGGDVVLVQNLAIKRFKISKDEYNHWLGKWRFNPTVTK